MQSVYLWLKDLHMYLILPDCHYLKVTSAFIYSNQVGYFDLDVVRFVQHCWTCSHFGKWTKFHLTHDLRRKDLGSQEENYSQPES